MEGVSCVVGLVQCIVDRMGAWEVREGLMPHEMPGAVNMGREVLTFVGVDVLFENTEINTEDQYPTCLVV